MLNRRVKRGSVALVAAVVLLPVSAEGEAAPIRECGNAGSLHDGQVHVYNVTSRVVSCSFARRFARRQMLYGGPACREDRWCTYRRWRCRHVAYRVEGDIRCTNSGGRVVRWQYS
jgi:hypothetical protein